MSERLEREVWDLERCTGCGLCVATCSKGVLDFPEEEDHPILERKLKVLGLTQGELDPCHPCEAPCVESCPRLTEWETGKIRSILSGRSRIPSESHQPIDIAISLLTSAFESGFINCALLTSVDKWTLKPTSKLVYGPKELMESTWSSHIWSPLLEKLSRARKRKLAVVGNPCVAQAIKKLLTSPSSTLENYKQPIRLVIGLFCSGVFSHDLVTEMIVKDMHIPAWKIRRIDVDHKNGKITIMLHDGSTKEIPLTEAQKYTRRGCASCTDFASEWADISIGTVGSEKGYSTIITRSHVGEECLLNAVERGFLETKEDVNIKELNEFIEMKKKRNRVQEVDSLFLQMLEALREPGKKAEVETKFGDVFPKKGIE